MKSIPYEAPELPILLTISSYIYLLNIAEATFNSLINAGLIGSLALGVIFGPEASNLLPDYIQHTFILLGYIGLLLLVFEAGLSTDISLLYHNIFLSLVVALTGVGLPIALSLLLLAHGYGYSLLQAFGAGAALCSTSLGTTLALLRPGLRQTKTGAVLLSAALLDDIIGLVFAAIIPNLPYEGSSSPNSIAWYTVARPILVSLAFAFGTPALAYILSRLLWKSPPLCRARFFTKQMQLLLIVSVTSGFVAGAQYAGTSELFGAYLAGTSLSYIFSVPTLPTLRVTTSQSQVPCLHDMKDTFAVFIQPLLHHIFSPIFFASIGMAIPIRSLVFVDGSRRVIWRGIVYSFLMILAKTTVGAWMLVHKVSHPRLGWCYWSKKSMRSHKSNKKESGNAKTELTHTQSAALVGLAMVARGEIALIVAQLARPLLVVGTFENNTEAYAVVIWAILITTVSGALGVGLLLRSWDKMLK
ncbi:Cation/H+ exchanger [Collybia nuda]|uniref:Cation/H+ exchanger n=1 Tax=Collybia nuda TaxID=64659 RepID=A0A9P5Y6T3_9AGAR|nr:Cation/H+ exchanger [Collybia nuda]